MAKHNRLIGGLLLVLLLAVSLIGCTDAEDTDGRLSIVATIFPEYDWVRQILGDRAADAELVLLAGNGVDLHSYQPTAADMISIADCDMFLYVGGPSDRWVEDALANAGNPNRVVVNLLEVLGEETVLEEETVEGMAHEHHDEADEHEAGEHAVDEHVWLSLKNASLICAHIAEQLAAIDPAHGALYAANAEAYVESLSALDAEYRAAVDAAPHKTLLFADRFPFRYLVEDYGLAYYAAFSGCSAESEASFKTIAFLAEKLNALSLSTLLITDDGDTKIAQTVIETANAGQVNILSMHAMQSVTADDLDNRVTYLSMMEENLDVLRRALQ